MVFPHPGGAFLNAFLCGGNHHFLWVSEVTLRSFWLLFGAFSVLHCHGVSPSRRCLFECFLVRRKSSFTMGFRSYVREFLAAFWCLVRPSLPLCFPCPGGAFLNAFLCGGNNHFLWVSKVPLRSFGCFLVPSPSFTAMVFPCPGGAFLSAFLCGGHRHFLWVSEVTLGSFWLLFGAFSVLHCHGVSPSGRCFFECCLKCNALLETMRCIGLVVRQCLCSFEHRCYLTVQEED